MGAALALMVYYLLLNANGVAPRRAGTLSFIYLGRASRRSPSSPHLPHPSWWLLDAWNPAVPSGTLVLAAASKTRSSAARAWSIANTVKYDKT